MNKELLCLPLVLALTACGGSDDSTPSNNRDTPPTVQSLENSGEIPKLDRSAELLGSDSDNNGIRDDIDNYIAIHFSETGEVAAATQAARANQSVLDTDLSNQTAVRQTNQKVSRATACIYDAFDESTASAQPAAVSRDLEAITYNTAERLEKYMEFNKALDGTSWSLPEGNSCE